jgi:topoisomerase-4 subunit A
MEKFGKGRERQTEIMSFDDISAKRVVIANQKLYVNRKAGFAGYGLKRSDEPEFVCDCSDLDDIIAFRKDGKYLVSRVSEKAFFGKNIIHVDVWRKGDERKVYHAVYRDPTSGKNYIKRFAVTAITRDREYDVTNGAKGAKLLYFEAHQNSEAELIEVKLSQGCRAKKKIFEFDFAELAIKGRSSQGNVLTKYPVQSIKQLSLGSSTLGGRKIWYDNTVGRLNTDERGPLLGEFDTEDRILVVYKNGFYEMTDFELTNRYEFAKIHWIGKFDPEQVITVVHYDGSRKDWYVKRFQVETTTLGEAYSFISEANGSKAGIISMEDEPQITFIETKGKDKKKEEASVNLAEFIDVKGWRSLGNKLSRYPVTRIKLQKQEVKPAAAKDISVGDTVEWSGKEVQGDLFQ